MLRLLLTLAFMALASSAIAADVKCELRGPMAESDLRTVLGDRAVEAVRRAAQPGWRSAARLTELVAPDAVADLGAGDVGRPLGKGLAGLNQLASTMNADAYLYDQWNYMSASVDPCGEHRVTVEFVDTRANERSVVEFRFARGRIVGAQGWQRSIARGSLNSVK